MVQSFPTCGYQTQTFSIEDPLQFKMRTLFWLEAFETAAYLDSNGHPSYPGIEREALVAAGALRSLVLEEPEGAFEALQHFWASEPCWLFGHLSYELKDAVERLSSNHPNRIGFPVLHFFQPRYLIEFKEHMICIHSTDIAPETVYREILAVQIPEARQWGPYPIQARFTKSEYLQRVQKIREHILDGDIYELNFCQEFYAEAVDCEPVDLFRQLNDRAKTPFAAYYKLQDRHLLCASPERFLKKIGDQVVSQPIKGTIQRGNTPAEDAYFRATLHSSEKDRAENVMIVDLVRNDLAKTCRPGSVQVDDLFGIYPFETVFQMISTISGRIKTGISPIDVLRQAFPMGSMTGAPKVKSMELIERYERSRRGLYSGTVGYISPTGDFDFNVVIRSLLYQAASRYLSFQVGGAIVYDSVPEKEYEECLLKAKGLLRSIHSTINDKA